MVSTLETADAKSAPWTLSDKDMTTTTATSPTTVTVETEKVEEMDETTVIMEIGVNQSQVLMHTIMKIKEDKEMMGIGAIQTTNTKDKAEINTTQADSIKATTVTEISRKVTTVAITATIETADKTKETMTEKW